MTETIKGAMGHEEIRRLWNQCAVYRDEIARLRAENAKLADANREFIESALEWKAALAERDAAIRADRDADR